MSKEDTKEIFFSSWEFDEHTGTSVSLSENGEAYKATFYKNREGQAMCSINRMDGITNPRVITMKEKPEEGKEFGTFRVGSNQEYMFLRGAKEKVPGQQIIYKANLFKSGNPRRRMVVRWNQVETYEGAGYENEYQEEVPSEEA